MPRRGFSLIEMFIAVLLVAAVAGLVLPRLFARVGEAEAESVAAQISSAGVLARADAVRVGVPVRLVLSPDGDGRLRLRGEPHESAELPEPDAGGEGGMRDDALLWPRTYLTLGSSWSVVPDGEAGGIERGGAGGAGVGVFGDAGGDGRERGARRAEAETVGVLLPDGRALAGGALVLSDGGENLVRLLMAAEDGRVRAEASRRVEGVGAAGEAEREAGDGEEDRLPAPPGGVGGAG